MGLSLARLAHRGARGGSRPPPRVEKTHSAPSDSSLSVCLGSDRGGVGVAAEVAADDAAGAAGVVTPVGVPSGDTGVDCAGLGVEVAAASAICCCASLVRFCSWL